jgi:phenylalanyl-tRNA synthetase beta subunit
MFQNIDEVSRDEVNEDVLREEPAQSSFVSVFRDLAFAVAKDHDFS